MRRFSYTPALTVMLSLSSLITVTSSHAETPYWYDVEVALIGYQDSQQIEHETWPEVIDHNSPELMEGEQPIDTTPWNWIDWWNEKPSKASLFNIQDSKQANELKTLSKPFSEYGPAFADKMPKFEKTKGMTVVWSKKWRQPIQSKQQSTNSDNTMTIALKAPLNLSDTISKGRALDEIEINGNIHLYRSRYLHIVSNLQVQHWRTLANSHELDKGLSSQHSSQLLGQNIIPSSSSSPLTTIDKIPLRAAHVNQSRRMRSNELHYIDHPMLGVLVRVTPIDYGTEPETPTE